MADNLLGKILAPISSLFGLKKLQEQRVKAVQEKFKDKKIYGQTSNANFFG